MLIKFTNASETHKGNSIYINSNQIAALFEIAKTEGGSLTTIVYGGQTGVSWEVEESLGEAVKMVNSVNPKTCGCK